MSAITSPASLPVQRFRVQTRFGLGKRQVTHKERPLRSPAYSPPSSREGVHTFELSARSKGGGRTLRSSLRSGLRSEIEGGEFGDETSPRVGKLLQLLNDNRAEQLGVSQTLSSFRQFFVGESCHQNERRSRVLRTRGDDVTAAGKDP